MNYMNLSTAALADAYGALKAEMAELAKVEAKIKAAISARMEASGDVAIEGDLFRVVKSVSERETLDADRIRAMLVEVPTKSSTVVSYRVGARKAA